MKSFPCQYCKGEGCWIEPVTDWGEGPTETCGWCEGEGLIEVGSAIHRRNSIIMLIDHVGGRLVPNDYPTPDEPEIDPLNPAFDRLKVVLEEIYDLAHSPS